VSYLCQKQIGSIRGFVTTKPESKVEFKKEIESFLNGDLSNEGVLEMLGQDVVISPALDALFTTDFSK
jgi:predicted helicase